MAQISQNWHLATLFGELLAPQGNAIHLKPAGDYVRPGHRASFATIVEAASRRGECALGYRTRGIARAGNDHEVRINPAKAEVRYWGSDDEVIVMAER